MMRLDTDPMTPTPRTARAHAEAMPLLIQVPRVSAPPARRARADWPATIPTVRAIRRGAGQPRRRLRRGVRRAGFSAMMFTAIAGTFALGWTTGIGPSRLPLMRAASPDPVPAAIAPLVADAGSRPDGPAPTANAAVDAPTGGDFGAPIADAEVPIVFPGYLLPDNNREESAHEGS